MMGKRSTILSLMLVMTVLLWAGPAISATQKQVPPDQALIGSWQCQGPYGVSRLVFESKSRLIFNGDPAKYTLTPGVIRVQDEDGIENYRYTLKGNSLNITFPDGSRLQCQRASPSQTGSVKKDSSTASAAGKGGQWQLQGTLCSWGGSSSSSSSYSRSTRVSFDGKGSFRYASESSFGSGAGMAYGRQAGSAHTGRYRVTGDKIHFTFGDGTSGTAQVHMRQSNGMITEFMYRGQLYATGLCN